LSNEARDDERERERKKRKVKEEESKIDLTIFEINGKTRAYVLLNDRCPPSRSRRV